MAQALLQSYAYPQTPAGQNTQNAGLWAPAATSSLMRPPHITEQQWQDFLRHRVQQQAYALSNVSRATGPHQLAPLPKQSRQSLDGSVPNSPSRRNSIITQQISASQPGHVYQHPLLQSQTVHLNSLQYQPSAAVRQASIGGDSNQPSTAGIVSTSHMPPNPGQLHNSPDTLLPSQVSDGPQHSSDQDIFASTSIPASQHTARKVPVHVKSPARSRSTNGSSSTDTSSSFTVHDDNATTVRLGRPSIESAYAARNPNYAQQTPPRLIRAQSSGFSTAMSQESPASVRSGPSPRRGRPPAGSPVNGQHQANGCATKPGTRGGRKYLPR